MKLQNLFIAVVILFSATVINANDHKKDPKDSDSPSGSASVSHTVEIEIPEVALLDIEGGNITLKGTAPTEAGNKVEFNQTNNALWINYSSIIRNKGSRKVTVAITDGEVPEGLELSVQAAAYSGNGEGTTGSVKDKAIKLKGRKAKTIITAIGSAYTGNGVNNGHNLTYKIAQSNKKDSYSKLRSDQSQTLTITYTLIDN